MTRPTVNYPEILKALRKRHVDFIIVGGVCAALHGAPLATFDLDLVHSREPQSLTGLWAALQDLGAHYRIPGRMDKKPGPSDLASAEHHMLMTRCGPLDLLGTFGQGRDYAQLLQDTVEMEIGPGLKLRVATLESLIKTKEASGLEKDRAVLPVLRRLLEEKSKS